MFSRAFNFVGARALVETEKTEFQKNPTGAPSGMSRVLFLMRLSHFCWSMSPLSLPAGCIKACPGHRFACFLLEINFSLAWGPPRIKTPRSVMNAPANVVVS